MFTNHAKEMLRKKFWFLGILVLSAEIIYSPPAGAAVTVPLQPSEVHVEGTQLIVKKRNPDGSLGAATPYIIHGVTWTAATRAPAAGPNPSNLNGANPNYPANVQYGFFFDWPNRDIYEGQQGHTLLNF